MGDKAGEKSAEKKYPYHHWKVTNFVYQEEPHPTIKLRCPGLNIESFDRDRNVKVTSIMITSALARSVALRRPICVTPRSSNFDNADGTGQVEEETFLDFTKLTSEYFYFMSSVEFVMSRAVYDNDIPKWPIDMKFISGYVGNSSVANVCHFYACNEDDPTNASDLGQSPLWTNTYQIVLVDKVTRKATQLPDWFKDKFKGKGCRDKAFILKPFLRPAVTFCRPSVVQWTDTDQFKHTNFTTYVRWALDALHAALFLQPGSTSGDSSDNLPGTSSTANGPGEGEPDPHSSNASLALRGITKETVARGLHKMQVSYMKECLEGDHVETHLWQEEGAEKELVLFSVVRAGEDVCQLKMWYFPPQDQEVPSEQGGAVEAVETS